MRHQAGRSAATPGSVERTSSTAPGASAFSRCAIVSSGPSPQPSWPASKTASGASGISPVGAGAIGRSAGVTGLVAPRAPTGLYARMLTPWVPNAAALDACGASEKVS